MGPVLADFINEKYLVLKALYDHQVCVGGETFAPLSQQEIAGLVGFARPKTISILQTLIDKGYVSMFCGMRGKYVVTQTGCLVIAYFENSNFGLILSLLRFEILGRLLRSIQPNSQEVYLFNIFKKFCVIYKPLEVQLFI